jgi:hypothetical protein
MSRHRATLTMVPVALADALQLTLALESRTAGQVAAQREIVVALESALDARRQRIIVSESTVNWVKWTSVLLQALSALVAIGLVHSDNRATAAIAMGIFATGVAVSIVLIASRTVLRALVGPDRRRRAAPAESVAATPALRYEGVHDPVARQPLNAAASQFMMCGECALIRCICAAS